MREWVAFWNTANSIYVNARHRDVHYRSIADDIRAYVPGPDAAVLDYGCGEALHADRVAAAAATLTLSDAAPAVREGLARRFAADARIAVRAPEEVEALPDASFDLIVMHSVAQYLTPDELDGVLARFRRLVKPDGRLVLGDVVPPTHSLIGSARALIAFAARNGFLMAALGGLLRTAFSDYSRLRARVGLRFYDEAAMLRKLAAAGFTVQRASHNIGHDTGRMTFVATPR